MIAINLRGSFFVGKMAIELVEGTVEVPARLIMTASDMACYRRETFSPYVASKHGVLGWCAPGRRNLHRGWECDAGRLMERAGARLFRLRARVRGRLAARRLWMSVVDPFATGRLARWEVVHRFLEQVLQRGRLVRADGGDHSACAHGRRQGLWSPRIDRLPYYAEPVRVR